MNSTIQKRSYFTYAILNALTFGIYGVVFRSQLDNDIEQICVSDGQQPENAFGKAWIISKLYNLMIFGIIGLPLSIAGAIAASMSSVIPYLSYIGIGGTSGFLVFLAVWAVVIIISFALEGLYLPSWWYTQQNRLVLNSHRMKMVINDNAFDTAVWRSLVHLPMNIISLLGYGVCVAGCVACVAFLKAQIINSALYGILCVFGGYFVGAVLLFIKNILNLPLYYTIKTVNRYAENMSVVYEENYNPMGLLDEDNNDNIFSRTINVLNAYGKDKKFKAEIPADNGATVIKPDNIPGSGMFKVEDIIHPENPVGGSISCIAGTNKGYVYNLAPGEELIIGKDPKTANIVISPEFKDVSRKHCGIKYSASTDSYKITDYSSNGTKINGEKMESGATATARKGSSIALGKGDNVFIVK